MKIFQVKYVELTSVSVFVGGDFVRHTNRQVTVRLLPVGYDAKKQIVLSRHVCHALRCSNQAKPQTYHSGIPFNVELVKASCRALSL